MHKAFTLIELLVVVLIIGILSAIALPQYTVAVEKSRVTEAVQNARALENAMKLYLLENGSPATSAVPFFSVSTIDLSGATPADEGTTYETENFYYFAQFYPTAEPIEIEISRKGPYYYQLVIHGNLNTTERYCYNGAGDAMGIKICHALESMGYTYREGEV